ncbi:MAG TPA: Hsp33 family molecular chaperone HslO [Caulobacterales bacterium]|nr:Hsp33 family molecular chaperone HslO [Caulobacterales bacterium]
MNADDIVAPFSLDAAPVRGRIARLGAGALDPILRRHDYPPPVAMLLGEALTLAALVGALLKVEGRLVVQAQGDGPVPLLVAEHRSDGGLRGYARLADGAATALARSHRVPPAELLQSGQLVLTIDQGGEAPTYQGVVPLEGETLARCAENYFQSSEQTPSRVRLAVGEVQGAHGPRAWRGGGLLMQRIAGDALRGDTDEDWSRARILFDTVGDDELIDPELAADRLLYRLFHEEGVRMGEMAPLADQCTCSAERLSGLMRSFTAEEVSDLIEPDGKLHARCQFCAREYLIDPEGLKG